MGRTSFFRRRSRLVQPLAALPAPSPVGGPAAPDTAPSGSQVIDDMLSMLTHFLPPPPLGVPAPGVSIVSLAQTGIGLGNWRGNEVIGTFGAVALKGGRLDAVVRFELWGNGPGAVDSDMTGLQARLLAARDMLRASGFLLVNSVDTPITEPFPSIRTVIEPIVSSQASLSPSMVNTRRRCLWRTTWSAGITLLPRR